MRRPGVLAVFASWRMAVTLLLGFSSGMPLALTAATLQAWMASENIDLKTIGIFSLVGLPYSLKFLWSPLMDRYVPPMLGRRRGWILVCQLAVVAGLVAMAFTSPARAPSLMALLAVFVAFASASQDIVVDAYRTDLLEPHEYGASTSLYIMGYRIAMLLSGGGALVLADHLSWRGVYLVMASAMSIGLLTACFAPEPKSTKPPRTLWEAVVEPFQNFFARKGAVETLLFLILYKLDTNLTLALSTPFMLELGFSKTEIGVVTKGFGMLATIGGTLFGGAVMVKLGIKRALWMFGITQALAGLSYFALAIAGHSYPLMVTAITVENVFSGMGIAAQSAFLMSLCDKRFTATQYALLSSFMALSRYIAGAPSGFLAEGLGWPGYYLACILIGIPGLLLLLRFDRWAKS